jgi:hypothetical protein
MSDLVVDGAPGELATRLYRCIIDGFCYESRDSAVTHMRMQHNITECDPLILRQSVVGGVG